MNDQSVEEIAQNLVTHWFIISMLFGSKKSSEFSLGYGKINQFQYLYYLIIAEVQCNSELLEYFVVRHTNSFYIAQNVACKLLAAAHKGKNFSQINVGLVMDLPLPLVMFPRIKELVTQMWAVLPAGLAGGSVYSIP